MLEFRVPEKLLKCSASYVYCLQKYYDFFKQQKILSGFKLRQNFHVTLVGYLFCISPKQPALSFLLE